MGRVTLFAPEAMFVRGTSDTENVLKSSTPVPLFADAHTQFDIAAKMQLLMSTFVPPAKALT